MWPYASEAEALEDALRLSRGMTYKAAAAGLDLGGGKTVLLGDPHADKSEALFRRLGQFVDTLSGKYITAEDVGVSPEDMVQVRRETAHVTGLPESHGGGGNPSPVTAYGVYLGMKACAKVRAPKVSAARSCLCRASGTLADIWLLIWSRKTPGSRWPTSMSRPWRKWPRNTAWG